RGVGAHRGRHLRLLRGDRRADLDQATRSAPDRDAVDRGAGAPRTPRARLSRRLGGGDRLNPSFTIFAYRSLTIVERVTARLPACGLTRPSLRRFNLEE